MNEKEIKLNFKKELQKNSEKYYPVKTLKELNFTRNQCNKCKNFFWSLNKDKICGEPSCSGGFRFIGKGSKKKLSYIDVWKEFSRIHKNLGYTPIKRYPVVSRWNPTTDFTIASIAAFQPYIVSGEVKPPANPLVIPQFCLRFSDIDNVGLSSSHFTGFVMMGEHAFVKPKDYNINKYLKDHLTWLNKGMGIKNEYLKIHEDAWLGGGNLGSSLEFFSQGLEISNQVYMQYELINNSIKELNIKVLDMGQGQERAAWFTQGNQTSYDATFPTVMNKLYNKTGIKIDNDLMKRFLPYSSYLNIDEIKDVDKTWTEISKKININLTELKNKILPLAALYSIAEHSRSLLVALNDSALPSNTASGYNLRVILRRALSFIDQYNWNLDLAEICSWHASYLKPLFPELSKNLDNVKKILDVEKIKYDNTKQKSVEIVARLIKEDINENKLLQLYDSHGISPEIIREEAIKFNRDIKIPENFYAKVAQLHEKVEQKYATEKQEKLNLKNIKETELLFYKNEKQKDFSAKVLKIIDNNVILDKTCFYPTSGGQLYDIGYLNDNEIADVFKQGNIIVHVLKDKPKFKENSIVKGKINWDRRYQLMQHHTTTHIINAAARKVLGNHVNQASAFKDVNKARLDITHYQSLSEDEIKKIEDEANKIVAKKIKVEKSFMSRDEAEKKYGTLIYQGGVVPGKNIRIVNIKNTDVEACGGTHLDNTSEVGKIKILKSTKISDAIVRLEYVAGKKYEEELNYEQEILKEASDLLNCDINQIPGRAEELFNLWKDVVKKGKSIHSFKLNSKKIFKWDILQETANILKTQPENITKTISRFLKELKEKI